MEDAREAASRAFGTLSSAFSKIVRRDKKPKELAASIAQSLATIAQHIQQATTSSSITGPATASTSVQNAQPVGIHASLQRSSSMAVVGGTIQHSITAPGSVTPSASSTLHRNTTTNSDDALISAQSLLTFDLDLVLHMLYGDSSDGASAVKPIDTKQAKEMIDLLYETPVLLPTSTTPAATTPTANSIPARLSLHLRYIDFEARKSTTRIIEYSLSQRRDISIPYFEHNSYLLRTLVSGYDPTIQGSVDSSCALCCDSILPACILTGEQPLGEMLLHSDEYESIWITPAGVPSAVSVLPTHHREGSTITTHAAKDPTIHVIQEVGDESQDEPQLSDDKEKKLKQQSHSQPAAVATPPQTHRSTQANSSTTPSTSPQQHATSPSSRLSVDTGNIPSSSGVSSAPTPHFNKKSLVTASNSAASPSNSATGHATNSNHLLIAPFFRYIDLPAFDISSHAFSTFKLMLTEYPVLTSKFLIQHYDYFFGELNSLLRSDAYLTKVQCFTFLSELLQIRANHGVMLKYVADVDNLKTTMMALRGATAIQLSVFHVLKIFITSPYKSDKIVRILDTNKRTFLAFLAEFEKDSQDATFLQHKAEVVEALNTLPPVAASAAPSRVGSTAQSSESQKAAHKAAQMFAAQHAQEQQHQDKKT